MRGGRGNTTVIRLAQGELDIMRPTSRSDQSVSSFSSQKSAAVSTAHAANKTIESAMYRRPMVQFLSCTRSRAASVSPLSHGARCGATGW